MTAEGLSFRRRVFVVMPFGKKDVRRKPRIDLPPGPKEQDETLQVDFDDVYKKLFRPSLEAAGLQPFRADYEEAAGDILKDMFAELVTADFVLADISILNANVFYELGIRHMVGPRGVICLHAGWTDRPFDVAPQRTFKYDGKLFRDGVERDAAWEKQVAEEILRLSETLRKAVAADRTTEGSPVYGNLPKLVPPDASQIGTARFKHYQAQSEEWNQRVTIAGKEGRAEDILTLAGDVPSPYYRRKLLRQCGDALLALGRFAQSEKIFKELCEDLDGVGSLEEFRVKTQLALLANRLGRTREAEQKLNDLANSMPGDPEGQGIFGRVYKDMWRTKWSRVEKLEERLSLAYRNAATARKSLDTYEVAIRKDLGSYFNGINVITLAALLEHVARANKRAVKPEVADLADLQTVVRLAATTKLDNKDESVWARATLGELHLALGHPQEALDDYEQATADPSLTWFNIRSMFEQVQLFQLLGYQPETVEPVAALLQQRLGELPHPCARFDKVVICSGHMIDAPDRKTPRFPKEKAEVVRAKIAQQLEQWKIGAGDLAVCGGACGADILFAEEALRRGAQLRLLLAQDIDDFVRDSVRHAGNDWVQRFYALREKADVATQPERLGKAPSDVSIYARTNLWIINTARVEAADSGKIRALLVWDEKPTGDGPGGTSDFEQKVRDLGGLVEIINPTKLP
jgi:tetratricopeptide (TPR) repeat protein